MFYDSFRGASYEFGSASIRAAKALVERRAEVGEQLPAGPNMHGRCSVRRRVPFYWAEPPVASRIRSVSRLISVPPSALLPNSC
jgi:hypothetical protein